jgi:hypothetical protein
MALGAHSETYSGVSMEAAPTPKPAISLPTYSIGRLNVGADWSAMPTQVMAADTISDHLRPNLSEKGAACKLMSQRVKLVTIRTRVCSYGKRRYETSSLQRRHNYQKVRFSTTRLRITIPVFILFSERMSF